MVEAVQWWSSQSHIVSSLSFSSKVTIYLPSILGLYCVLQSPEPVPKARWLAVLSYVAPYLSFNGSQSNPSWALRLFFTLGRPSVLSAWPQSLNIAHPSSCLCCRCGALPSRPRSTHGPTVGAAPAPVPLPPSHSAHGHVADAVLVRCYSHSNP